MKNIIALFVAITCFSGVSLAQKINKNVEEKPIVIKLSHVVKDGTPKALASFEFKRIMEQKFPEKVFVEIYGDNKLFKDREETEALELGAVDVIIPTSGKIAGFYGIKEFELFDLPFMFKNTEDITNFTLSKSGQKLLNFLNDKNKTVLAVTYWSNDFRNYNGSKFFKTPDDFKGLTARTESAGTMKRFYDSLEVKETINLGFSELAKAMKKQGENKVDVASNPNSNYNSIQLYESSKFITLSKHDVNTYVLLTNKRWFNNLPIDIKTGFLEAAKESGLYHFKIAQNLGLEDLEKVKKIGTQVYTWTKEERELFKLRAVASHQNYLKNINKEFLDEVYELVK